MGILTKNYVVVMEDGSKWAVPVRFIAEHRAKYFAERDNVSIAESLNEDTSPLFEEDEYEIHDWAANNLNFSDVKGVAKMVSPPDVDYEDGWANGEYEIQEPTND
ncbi:hypothetical protein [Acinetobacter cumulans]|uniref:hypothetical protein n=1 Tax=Acinetobacter cumulans TaxID=2136182 RepID=UPI0014446B81|nr:hypothetical protein [Acinetobacter cumulans]